MFFERVSEIPEIALKNGLSVFVVPVGTKSGIAQAIETSDGEEAEKLNVETVREIREKTGVKQGEARFVVLYIYGKVSDAAQNAMLKEIEEPKENYHFVILTDDEGKLLATVKSRAQIYRLREGNFLEVRPRKEKVMKLAKRLLVAEGVELIKIGEEINKDKEKRELGLMVVETAIELLFKTYLIRGQEKFLVKLPKLMDLHKNLALNGNLKLHFVADLC